MAEEPRPSRARWRRRAVIAAAVTALYTLAGFLLFPRVLHGQLEKRLAAALHRPVSIARVRANPFALSVTIDGLLVRDRDGTSPFITWDRLYVNARIVPIVKRELDLDTLSLSGLAVWISLGPDGRLNCEDILEAYSGAPKAEARPKGQGPVVFGVDRLNLERAKIVFVDRSRARPFDTTLGPVTVRLEHFRTRPDSTSPYAFSGITEAGERFSWRGSLLIDPLRSQGELALEDFRFGKYAPYYERQVALAPPEGRWSVRSRYDLEWGPDKRELRLSDGVLQVRDFVLTLRGQKTPVVELPELDVTGIRADILRRTAEVSEVAVRGGTVRARRDREGRLNLTEILPPRPPASPDASPPYRWTVRRVAVSGHRVELEDEVPERPVSLALAPIDLKLENLAADPRTVTRLELAMGWNGKGSVKAKGTVTAARPAADLRLDVSALDLPSLDPYLAKYGDLAARLGGGQLAVGGQLRVDRGAEPMAWSFEGDASISALALLDAERGEELVRWRDLRVSGLKTVSSPPGLAVASIRWVEPRIRVHVAQDRSTNLQRVLGASPGGTSAQASTGARGEPRRAQGGPPAYPVSIDSLQIVRGRAGLVDRSVRPPAIVNVTDIDVRARALSNQVTARSSVAARALVSGGPLEVKGTLSQRLVNDATDLVVKSKGIDLTPLGPYCAKHVGYVLERGKLDLDLEYRVQQRNLAGKNVVRVDQFSLGDKTNSPDATSLPVKLGLAILRDKDGVIDLDVPVSGNIDDPSFSLGGLIWHAIGNVFTKAATAPFTMLGKLVGGGAEEKLDVIDFVPGTHDIAPASGKALQTLVKALQARPALHLEIEGTADEAADGQVLRLTELKRRAREAKWKAAGRSGATSPQTTVLSADEYQKWVEVAYQTSLSAASSGAGSRSAGGRTPQPTPATPPTLEEKEARLLENVEVPAEGLSALAQQRSEVIRQRLAASNPPIDAGRLFLVQGGERAKKEGGAHAYFTLK